MPRCNISPPMCNPSRVLTDQSRDEGSGPASPLALSDGQRFILGEEQCVLILIHYIDTGLMGQAGPSDIWFLVQNVHNRLKPKPIPPKVVESCLHIEDNQTARSMNKHNTDTRQNYLAEVPNNKGGDVYAWAVLDTS
ncbi:hypothetical protein CBL_04510 [Carabus blaptoides fortunei]